ncbi:related to peptide transporter Mtd1 [Ustilago sp. UG-2017b]|nr:related to peptide transporter Mtd1 [Ustilago sp. UG-2017b]
MSSTTPVPHPHPDSSSPEKDSPCTSIGSEARNPARGKRIIRTGDDVSNHLVSDRDDKDACFTLRSITLGLIGATFQAVLTQIYRVQTDKTNSSDLFGRQKLFYPSMPVSSTTAVLAGIFRPIIVYPLSMVYWSTLPLVDLFQALHCDKSCSHKRLKLFWWSFSLMGIYEILPAYIFPTLNSVSIPCLAAMHTRGKLARTLTNIFGGAQSNQGLGLFSLLFDWQYITSLQLSLPLYEQLAVFVGGILDEEKLEQVGYPIVASSYAWGMLAHNAAIGALVAHVVLFWGRDIWKSIQAAREGKVSDRHWKGMQRYKEAPSWWYLLLLLLSFVFGLVVVLAQDTTLRWYGYMASLLLGTVVAPFSGILYAMLGNGISTNNLTKMIGGHVVPGRPLANLYFYAWSHSTIAQVINLCNDLKLGQYLKIPPRSMFITQVLGTVYGAFLNYAVASTIISCNWELIHSDMGSYVWSGAYYQNLNASGVAWSMARYMYGPAMRYFIVPMAVLLGMGLVVVHFGLTCFVGKIGLVKTTDLVLPTVLLYSASMTTGQKYGQDTLAGSESRTTSSAQAATLAV